MARIAYLHGFHWQTLWTAGENTQLKQVRKNPNLLCPGDRVTIPDKRQRHENGATEKKHRFRRKGVPSKVRFRLLRNGKPRQGLKWRLCVDRFTCNGTTGKDGYLNMAVPPDVTEGELTITDKKGRQEIYTLKLGHLEPPDQIKGLQQRLRNLGYDCPVHGRIDDLATRSILAFQGAQNLESTGKFDEQTRAAIEKAHAS